MSARTLLASAALLLLASVPGLAEKLLAHMTPGNLASNGFAIRSTRQENGIVQFHVSRDLSKAQWPGRSAVLEVRDDEGPIVRCPLEPEKRNNTVTYRFDVAQSHLSRSFLTVSEVQTNANGEPVLGGGTIYEFYLADYLDNAPRR
jgi:hypothetical protein